MSELNKAVDKIEDIYNYGGLEKDMLKKVKNVLAEFAMAAIMDSTVRQDIMAYLSEQNKQNLSKYAHKNKQEEGNENS